MGTTSSKVEESSERKENFDYGDLGVGFTSKKVNGSSRAGDDHNQNEKENYEVHDNKNTMIRRVPKAIQGEQVAAGWPTWLAAVAGEAINGWLPRRGDTFEKLDKIGEGTYSNVYKARDVINGKIVALKKVRFDNLDPESVKFMAREILVMRRLDHPNIIKLEGLVTSRMSCTLYLVLEYMEHDLTGISSLPGVKFTEEQVKCYMYQLLSGLEYCHSRGVLHRDIKCSNLLIDNRGTLKIADFGLSTFFDTHQSFALTSRVVTLWYRPPELLLGAIHYGISVDLWSTGCVLGELCAGRPIMPGRTEVEQLHKIYKLCGSPSDDCWRKWNLPHASIFKPQQAYRRCLAETFKDLPRVALGLLDTLLSIDPEYRGTAASALQSEFFTTKPFACDPSSLPKYPPSKEADVILRERKPDSHNVLADKGQRGDYSTQRSQNLRACRAPPRFTGLVKMLEEQDHYIQETSQEARPEKRREKGQARMRVTQIDSPVAPSFDVDQLLEEHDQHIQETAQRSRLEKKRACKIQGQKT